MSDYGAVLKSARPRAIAALRRFCGDLAWAEDAFQDAAEQALRHWPERGLPDQPTSWLIQTARRKIIDGARRKRFQTALAEEPIQPAEEDQHSMLDDDLLKLIFTCCHPALSEDAQSALTLKIIAGLTTEDVALAFLVPTRTMEQRLTRARSKLRKAGIPYKVPEDHELEERLQGVLQTLYLIFNQGYSARREQLIEPRLCREAIWLTKLVRSLFPDQVEISGLLALMMLHHARHQARQSDQGELIPLAKQDRSLWDQALIREADTLLKHVMAKYQPGPYQTQAAIAALHCQAKHSDQTDWAQIALLYSVLEAQLPNPIVSLNRAVALGESGQVQQGLAVLKELEAIKALQRYTPFHLARSRLFQLSGDSNAAQRAMLRGLDCSANAEEQAFLKNALDSIINHYVSNE